jgi:hypothetical protein
MLTHCWCEAPFRLGTGLGIATACTRAPSPAPSIAAADPAVRVPAAQYAFAVLAGAGRNPAPSSPATGEAER